MSGTFLEKQTSNICWKVVSLEQVDKEMAETAKRRYSRLLDWSEDPHEYGSEALVSSGKGFKGYEEDVVQVLQDLLSKRLEYERAKWDGEEYHGGEQNARLVKGQFLLWLRVIRSVTDLTLTRC